ncbi:MULTISPECIES: MFS transporter [Brevibacillus]|jgi:putative MFS transporter|uniref:MFS transporter n=1 Tax=Brevibacillus TaxID=55080 RepID=UPI00156B6205|nr:MULTISPECIES: MFS transporter [Brevibacillus]MDH6352493.1 putative MFS transporter [Brevibacillus sp. 1238]MDR4998036.1 MFS transporter [Brevibacillus parabrevis]MED2258176.1 MFS transporter [Brevibacillus parabrevis]NRQ55992.1 MFS transporter [Brevibacillus sp. HD1.4A]WDV94847.1 MFS transporter [Brevibacillus parabrevis]
MRAESGVEVLQKRSVPVGALFENMPVTSQHWQAGLVLFFSFVIESWEMMIVILASASIGGEFQLDGTQIGSLIGSIYLGMIPGCLLWGKLVDKIGRKQSMIISFGLYGIISLISAFSLTYEMLWWTRFLSGVALSGVLVATFPYFEELLPMKVRGKAAVYLASGWPVGYLLAIGTTYLFMELGWRWIIGVSSLAGLWFLAIAAFVPESPYWLAGKGRHSEAKEVIDKLSKGTMQKEINSVELAVENVKTGSFLEIFSGQFRRSTILQLVINFSFSWGYWGLSSWMPALLAKKGLSAPEGMGFMAISALFMFPGYMVSSYLTGKYGRKKVMALFVFFAAVSGFGFANANTLQEMYIWNFALSFFSLGAWGVWDTWMAELYPTEVRGVSYSVGMTGQRVANAIAPSVIGAMLAINSSFLTTVSFISAFLVVTFVASLFLKETEGEILH